MTRTFNPNNLNSYTVAQLRALCMKNKLNIGSISYMNRQTLIDNIAATDYWQEKIIELESTTNEKLGEIKGGSIEMQPLKPLVLEDSKENKENNKQCSKCMSGGCDSCNGKNNMESADFKGKLDNKITINSNTNENGNSIIVIMINK